MSEPTAISDMTDLQLFEMQDKTRGLIQALTVLWLACLIAGLWLGWQLLVLSALWFVLLFFFSWYGSQLDKERRRRRFGR